MQWRALQQCMPTSRKKQQPCLPWSCLLLSAPPKAQLSKQVQIWACLQYEWCEACLSYEGIGGICACLVVSPEERVCAKH